MAGCNLPCLNLTARQVIKRNVIPGPIVYVLLLARLTISSETGTSEGVEKEVERGPEH